MLSSKSRVARGLCTGRCQGLGPQGFVPTGLVPELGRCRFCSLIKSLTSVRPDPMRLIMAATPHEGTQASVAVRVGRSGLVTIGYERRSREQFLAAMRQAEVQVVVDVRWSAISQVAAFCEEPLRRAVLAADLGYLHLAVLGSPPALRQQLERMGNYAQFFAAYRQYLADAAAAQQTLTHLADLARERRIALLCRERDHEQSHRSVLAEQLATLVGQPVEHL